MSTHRFDLATFDTPDGWLAVGPGMVASPGDFKDQLFVTVQQSWLSEATAALDIGQMQLEMAATFPDYELIQSKEMEPERGGDAFVYVCNLCTGRGVPSRRVGIVLVQGPLACHLTVDRPAHRSEQLDEVAESVAGSLRIENGSALERADNRSLGAAAVAEALDQTVRRPRLKLALEVPNGWTVSEENDGLTAILSDGNVSVRAARLLGREPDLHAWLGERLSILAAGPGHLDAWMVGPLDSDRDHAMVDWTHEPEQTTWAKRPMQREVAWVAENGDLVEWSVRANTDRFPAAAELARAVFDAATPLEPEACETPVVEPWLDLVLRGPWSSAGEGLYYTSLEPIALLHLYDGKASGPLEKTRPKVPDIIDELRQGYALLEVTHEEEAVGSWRGTEAYRYSLDARFAELGPRSVRNVTAESKGTLYSVRLTGSDREQIQAIYLELLDGLRLPGMQRS